MTDTTDSTPPFPGFPGFPPAEMLDRMWGMMRLSPFGSALSGGAQPGGNGLGPSLSMMSDMMAPLTNVEELDKRIT
ncbi:MAG TPA: transcriptional regulator, partial [Paraburkholderia sp.]